MLFSSSFRNQEFDFRFGNGKTIDVSPISKEISGRIFKILDLCLSCLTHERPDQVQFGHRITGRAQTMTRRNPLAILTFQKRKKLFVSSTFDAEFCTNVLFIEFTVLFPFFSPPLPRVIPHPRLPLRAGSGLWATSKVTQNPKSPQPLPVQPVPT